MLALLPQILFLGAFAATLIRVVVAIMLLYGAWKRLSHSGIAPRLLAVIEVGVGTALFVGAWTQAAAIVGVLAIAVSLVMPRMRLWPRSTLVLLLVMTLSLVVTGPGAFAFDLPL